MIRHPLGLRLQMEQGTDLREQIRSAAVAGARGLVLDAAGVLSPDRLSATGRRDLKNLIRSVDLTLSALALPTRRPFDSLEQLDDRLARADRAFEMAYELGCRLAVARVGAVPVETTPALSRETFDMALRELGRLADHRGIRFALETGPETGATARAFLDRLDVPTLGASLDPRAMLRMGHDPVLAVRELGEWVLHAYASDATGPGARDVAANPRDFGFPPGMLDWEEYLGALEEIAYRGSLTVWPDPAADPFATFRAYKARFDSM